MPIREYKNVSYGPYERNVLDAYIVDNSNEATPVLIYFHGGGYVGGDKNQCLSNELIQCCLSAGISIVTCNYRFITTAPFPAPMNDGTRAIQFVRYKAKKWGLDVSRIASSGSSAGGHIALWNALKGNRAMITSSDPIKRFSSDVSAFVGFGTQVSKDQRFYEDIYDGPHIQPNLILFYGISSLEEFYQPDNLKLAEEASAINHMSARAPPAFMMYDYELEYPYIPSDASVGEVIHHPVHGYALKQEYDKFNIPYVLQHNGNPVHKEEIINFLLEHLKLDCEDT